MKTLRFIFLAVLLVLITSGCSAKFTGIINDRYAGRKMKNWMGRSASDLIAYWGKPNSMELDGKGGRILIWRIDRCLITNPPVIGYSGRGTSFATQVGTEARYTRVRKFHVNKAGVIYSWSWEGL